VRTEAFLDTSVLLYAVAANDRRSAVAIAALEAGGLISVQVVWEFTSIARNVLGRSWPEVYEALSIISILCPEPLPVRWSTYEKALELVHQDGLLLQDALIAASALQAGCSVLLTGIYADGFILADQLTISNPFGPRVQH
jgi:predicted nucleic acid-binding protein